jgi:hypothetical protein
MTIKVIKRIENLSKRINISDIGFFIHTPEMFNHYKPVWEKLDGVSMDLVLYGSKADREKSRAMAMTYGYSVLDFEDVIKQSCKYSVLVSNHSICKHKGKPLNLILGKKQVRFMYALGKAKHNFASWNNHYDMILCFGPFQAQRLSECCSATIFQMGYPRYDRFFTQNLNRNDLLRQLDLDKHKSTIVWLPTWRELSSIDVYADVMSRLSEKYNVVVKTHPLSEAAEPLRLKRLKTFKFTKVITDIFDNLELFYIADLVVSDYGGTAFGALYLDKPLLLLNLLNAEKDDLTGSGSPDILLRKHIINVNENERSSIGKLIEDEGLWSKQSAVRQKLRREHFAPTYGFSADIAAKALKNIDYILKMT